MASQPPLPPGQHHQMQKPYINPPGVGQPPFSQAPVMNGSSQLPHQANDSAFHPPHMPPYNQVGNPHLVSQWTRPPLPSQVTSSPLHHTNSSIPQRPLFMESGIPSKPPLDSGVGKPPTTLPINPTYSGPASTASNNSFGQPIVNGNGAVNGTQYPPTYTSFSGSNGTSAPNNQLFSAPVPSMQQIVTPASTPHTNATTFPAVYNSGYPQSAVSSAQTPVNSGPPWSNQMQRPPYMTAQGQQQPTQPPMDGRRQYPPNPSYLGSQTNYPGQFQNANQMMGPLTNQMNNLSVTSTGFDKLWGIENLDLLQARQILPAQGVEVPKIRLKQEHMNASNCHPDIFRCTLTKIPETNSILQKSRLPMGILIHPFKDLTQLPVIQCQTIVRCRSCRTYINPFVYFVDQRRWKCNLCFRVNELPDEFQFDPISNSYGDPSRRPEIKNATIEFIAPAEYMLRPPQPPIYLYLLDTSHYAVDTGYLKLFCEVLLDDLDKIPGDSRTQIGFITYDSTVHFYDLSPDLNQPQQLIVMDIDDIYLPRPNDLLVNLNESKQMVVDLLEQLPTRFNNNPETNCALGAALQAAFKLVSSTGGRISVFQASLPNVGPGALASREDPNLRASKDVPNLNPATDFYKKLALDCSGQQVAVDLFLLGGQYMDIASLSCVSKFSGGCMYHFPGFHYIHNPLQAERMECSLRRYLTRKIGFESVMRIRCTRGLQVHTFHGNFFVRSTDLLSLPNINPDAGFGLQVSIEESLNEVQNVCFQAALLYTSSKGERRIRVHTMCLPIASNVTEVIQSADQQCIIGLLAKMAVDRSMQRSIGDARDALINVCVDVLSAYKASQTSGPQGLLAPMNLRLLPLYVAALLKSVALRTGQSTRLDDRVFAMNQFKVLPLSQLMLSIYPDLYPIHNLNDQGAISQNDLVIPQPPRLHLSAEMVDTTGCYLLDTGDVLYLYVGRNASPVFLENALGSTSFLALPEQMFELPDLETPESERLRNFVGHLQNQKASPAVLQLIREDSKMRNIFTGYLVDGRTETTLSYIEFLNHLKNQVK